VSASLSVSSYVTTAQLVNGFPLNLPSVLLKCVHSCKSGSNRKTTTMAAAAAGTLHDE
jgi:hypothetical protein